MACQRRQVLTGAWCLIDGDTSCVLGTMAQCRIRLLICSKVKASTVIPVLWQEQIDLKQRERGKRDNTYASRAGSFLRPRLGLPEATLLSTLSSTILGTPN